MTADELEIAAFCDEICKLAGLDGNRDPRIVSQVNQPLTEMFEKLKSRSYEEGQENPWSAFA